MRSQLFVLLACAAVALAARVPRQAETTAAAAAAEEDAPAEPVPTLPATEVAEEDKKEDNKTDRYTSKFDNIDVDQILKSERLITNYFKCLMDRGPCTPDATELKRVLPDALESMCSKCSEKQRTSSEKVVEYIIKNKPAQWKELQAKYDPKGTYKSKYQTYADEKGIKLEE